MSRRSLLKRTGAVAAASAVGLAATDTASAVPDPYVYQAERDIHEVWNRGRLNVIDDIYHPDMRFRIRFTDLGNTLFLDRNGYRDFVRAMRGSLRQVRIRDRGEGTVRTGRRSTSAEWKLTGRGPVYVPFDNALWYVVPVSMNGRGEHTWSDPQGGLPRCLTADIKANLSYNFPIKRVLNAMG
jgi:hypothetical protein